MITLKKKLEEQKSPKGVNGKRGTSSDTRVSIRDQLLAKEVQEMEQNLQRPSCAAVFDDPDRLSHFALYVSPEDGFWKTGKFKFVIDVPEGYNIVPPKVVCCTRIWHPNISEDGEVCLSLLRENSLDSHGWAPTRRLKDVAWGLNSLFTDLLNFDDPLNIEAADHYEHDRESFAAKVKDYIARYARR